VALEGFAGDVVAAQGGLGAGVAEQSMDVAQWDSLMEPDGADGAPSILAWRKPR